MTEQNTYVVTGTISDGQLVALDELLPIKEGKVRLVVEAIKNRQQSYVETMEAIRESQRKRGFQPPTKEEVDEYIRAERDWGPNHADLS